MTDLIVTNTSTLVGNDDVARWVYAVQRQIHEDLRPFWGVDGNFHFLDGFAAAPGIYRMILKDLPDNPADLGFHLDQDGTPEARIFVQPTLNIGWQVSKVMSHEGCEMFVNPLTTRLAPDNINLAEACDPVQATDYTDKDGIVLSNFVTAAYFKFNSDSRYDFMELLTSPVDTLLEGGYQLARQGNGYITKAMRLSDTGMLHPRVAHCGRSTFIARRLSA